MGETANKHLWADHPGYPPKVALVFNPVAGNYCPNKLKRLRKSFEDEQFAVHCYDSRSFQLQSLASDVDLVCVSGGDGTVRTALRNHETIDTDTAYCVYPSGTINLLAREAGYRKSVSRFVHDLARRKIGSQHYSGRIGKEIFLCCASIGPDSHVVASVSPWLKKYVGQLAYGAATARLLWEWPRHWFDLNVDGVSHGAEAIFVLKGRFYAGPWVLDERAGLGNAQFRLLLLPRARRRDCLRLALFALFGPASEDSSWTRLDARTVEITGPAGIPIQADGDIVARTPAMITIDARSMTFL